MVFRKISLTIAVATLLLATQTPESAQIAGPAPATATAVGDLYCAERFQSCAQYDAIVFVHGIYGSDTTFVNQTTHFDLVKSFPRRINDRNIDVYRLNYQSAFASWAKSESPDFEVVANTIFAAMAPVRKRQYRSIGWIAHSLGGNFVSTYVHMITSRFGHPQRSENAFVITLATPVIGSQVADIADVLKRVFFMPPGLLTSLTKDNLYLTMLNNFRKLEAPKGEVYGCRAVDLHAAYEQKYLGPLLIVTRNSAAESVSQIVSSPVVGFERNHSTIAKPSGQDDEVYRWVVDKVTAEYGRLSIWDKAHADLPPQYRLCADIPFKPETSVDEH